MMRSSRQARAAWLLGGAIVVVSVMSAALMTAKARDSVVEVGLDLTEPAAALPVLCWGDDAHWKTAAMQRIPEKHASMATFFEFGLAATGERNPASGGTEVVAGNFGWLNMDNGVAEPPGSWAFDGMAGRISARCEGGVKPFFRYKEYMGSYFAERDMYGFSLIKSPTAGVARLNLSGEEKTIDLYRDKDSQESAKVFIELKPRKERTARYYGAIPRREFIHARIAFPAYEGNVSVFRLYVASFIPRIFFKADREPGSAVGRITERWTAPTLNGQLALPALPAWERGGVWTFLAIFVSSCLFLAAVLALAWLAVRLARWLLTRPPTDRPIRPFSISAFLIFCIPLLAVWLFYLGCCYPGIMTTDSVEQWDQAHGAIPLQNDHPAFHTLTIKALCMLWDSPAVVALAQALAMSGSLAYALALLLRVGVPWPLTAVAFLSALASIRNGTMAVTLWRDIPYAVVVLSVIIFLTRLCFGKARERRSVWLGLGILLGLAPLFRHNGLILTAGLMVLLPLFFWHSRKGVWVAILSGVVLYGAAVLAMSPFVHKPSSPIVNKYGDPGEPIGKFVLLDAPISPEECRVLDEASRVAPPTHESWLGVFLDIYSKNLLQAFNPARFSGIRILHYIHGHSIIYWPPQPFDKTIGMGVISTSYATAEVAKRYGYPPPRSFFPKAYEKLAQFFKKTEKRYLWLFWRPGLHFWLILAAIAILLCRTRDYRLLVIYLPVLVNTLAFLLIETRPIVRYYFPMTFASGFLACLAFIPKGSLQETPAKDGAAIRPSE